MSRSGVPCYRRGNWADYDATVTFSDGGPSYLTFVQAETIAHAQERAADEVAIFRPGREIAEISARRLPPLRRLGV